MTNLKILVIGNDTSLLLNNSQANVRAKDYASCVEKYDLVTLAEEKSVIELGANSFAYGVKNKNKLVAYLNIWIELLRLNKLVQYDLVSAQDPFEFGFLAFLFSKMNKCKFHLQEHGDFFGQGCKYWLRESLLNYFRYFLGKYLLKKADGIRVVSRRIKNSLAKINIDVNKISIVPIISKQDIKSFQKTENECLNIVFVGRLVEAKNIKMILKAIDICYQTNDFKGEFNFIGSGKLKNNIEKFIFDNKLNNQVKLINWTDDLTEFYLKADILVLTSWHEGWGRVVVDAGAYGVVPIMTKVGCAEELVVNDKNGIIVNYNDHQQLAQKLIYFSNNRDQLKKLSDCIKKDVVELQTSFDLKQQMLESWQKTVKPYKL